MPMIIRAIKIYPQDDFLQWTVDLEFILLRDEFKFT